VYHQIIQNYEDQRKTARHTTSASTTPPAPLTNLVHCFIFA
jgi:hypothetical protein